MILPIALLLTAQAQEPAVEPAVEQVKWQRLNHLALIVNEKAVTSLDLNRRALNIANKRNIARNDKQQMVQVQMATIGMSAREMLEEQGGHDLGFEPERVDMIVAQQLEREEELAGSIAAQAEFLQREQLDSAAHRAEVESWVYRRLYSDCVTGKGAGPAGRPTVDGFVRPGRIQFEYTENGLVHEPQVKLTQLIVTFDQQRGPEETLALTQELRDRVLAGEDMGQLCEDYGATPRGTHGATQTWIPLLGLKRLNNELYAAIDDAEVGDLSPVLPYEHEGKHVGYICVRVDELRDGPLPQPELTDRDYQRNLRTRLTKSLEDQRVLTGLSLLAHSAYVWPAGALDSERRPVTPSVATAQPAAAGAQPQGAPSGAPPAGPGSNP